MMVAKIKAAGASEVVQIGISIKEADAHLREVVIKAAESRGEEAVYVPPFDHPDIWDGHTTLIDELRQQFNELGESPPDVIACSVGGGGLFNGIIQGLEKLGGAWDATDVLCVETKGCDALARSLEASENITLDAITSQATSLGARRVSDRTFDLATRLRATGRVKNAVLTDAEAAMGCWRFADDERIMVELACGVNLALCYGGRLKRALGRPVHPDEKVVIEVCGGNGVTTGMLQQWKQEFAYLDGNEMNGNEDAIPSMHTGPN